MAEMPSALVAACLPPEKPAPTPAAAGRGGLAGGEGITSPERLLASLLDTVARAPEGRRRTTLYGASRGVARMVSAGIIDRHFAQRVLTDAGRAAEQTEREIRAAIAGGFKDEGVSL